MQFFQFEIKSHLTWCWGMADPSPAGHRKVSKMVYVRSDMTSEVLAVGELDWSPFGNG
jgi:hypothetical protein